MAFWNNPNVTGVEQRARSTLSGFKTFILRGNVVDLAVGIMIGAAFTGVVSALVGDIITPLIPGGNLDLSRLAYHIGYSNGDLKVGDFIKAVISFLILALVIYYFIVRPVNTLIARYKPKEDEAPPAMRDCPYCLSSVHLLATRCAYCTSPLPPLPPQQQQPQPAAPGPQRA